MSVSEGTAPHISASIGKEGEGAHGKVFSFEPQAVGLASLSLWHLQRVSEQIAEVIDTKAGIPPIPLFSSLPVLVVGVGWHLSLR